MMASFLKTRGRPLTVLIAFALSLATFVAVTHFSEMLGLEWGGLAVAALLMLVAIPCHWFGGRSAVFYVLSFFLTSTGMGFAAGAYYGITGLSVAFDALMPATLLPLLLVLLLCLLLLCFPDVKAPIVAVFALLEVGLIVASVVFWVKRGGEFYAFSLFCHAIAIFETAVCGVTVSEEERSLLRDISFGGFGMFSLVAAAALVAVALVAGDGCDCDCDCGDGDCCDCSGCDCGGGDARKRKKQ